MKTPKKSSKRHGLESNYSEDSPSKKQRQSRPIDVTIIKTEEEPLVQSYSQDIVVSSQQPTISEKKKKLGKKCSGRSSVKQSLTEVSNTDSDLRITETKQSNASCMYIPPKAESHISNEEKSLDNLDIENLDSNETANELRKSANLEKLQTNADKSNNLSDMVKSNNSRIKQSAEDSENVSKLSQKKKKSKQKIRAKEKQYNTLLSMMNNSSSCSDTDNENETNDDTFDVAIKKKKNRINTSSLRLCEPIGSSDEANELLDSHFVSKSENLLTFGLDEEAKDVREMISTLEEENQLPEDDLKKLSQLRIKLNHPVPPQHMVETCAGSRGPTKEQKTIIEKLGPIRRGKFTPEEDNIIMQNWRSFCETHDWDQKDFRPFLYMRHQKIGFITAFEQRQKFVQYLAHGLPWRTLYSVYWRFRNLCQPHLQSRYTRDEDALVLAHMKNCSAGHSKNVRNFSELAKILKRTRASVWRRYRLLKKNIKSTNIEWDLRLVEKFIKKLMSITLCNDIGKLKDLDIPQVVWKKLSTKMKIPSDKLKSFWLEKLHMQLFCEMPIYLNEIRIKLIEYFYVKGISNWWEIEWSTIAKHFDGMTSLFLAQIFSRLFYEEKLEGMELGEMVEYGYKLKKTELQEDLMDACLPRISFENGTVKLLDKKSDNHLKNENVIEYFLD